MPKKKTSSSLAVVVLAAGKGKRLKSKLPKVLHDVCGRPSLWHVLRAARALKPSRLIVVVGPGKEQVEETVRSWNLSPAPTFVDQGEPLGTGHAVLAAEQGVGRAAEVVVLAADDPLIEGADLRRLLATHRRTKAAATIITTEVEDPTGYGRVIRERSRLVRIAEEREATAEVRAIREISTCVYAFRREDLYAVLPLVGRSNRQHEYYLPDALPILLDKGERVSVVPVDYGGWAGVNSRATTATVSRMIRDRVVGRHMDAGVTFVDPDTAHVGVEVRIGRDTVIGPLTLLEGSTRIGGDCRIGPSTRIVDSRIGEGSIVEFSVVRGSRIGKQVSVGPFASIRPGTWIADRAKAGTFVEVKGSRIGEGSKVPHLSYVGDATIGKRANVGAATVTVNYDGYAKHETLIGDDARVGSDTMLVAPVRVGKGAVTGAGSVITKDVPAGALAVERSEQVNVKGYRKRKDDRHKR